MSKQSMQIQEAQLILGPVVPPVTLRQKFISILDSSTNEIIHNQSSADSKSSTLLSNREIKKSTTQTPKQIEETAPLESIILKTPMIREFKSDETEHLLQAVSAVLRSDIATSKAEELPEKLQESKFESGKPVNTLSIEKSGNELSKKQKLFLQDGKISVPDESQKRDVMQFFQEQEQSLHQQFLHLPQSTYTSTRSLFFKSQQSAGLEHLENLIRLMEKLTSLKDENSKLRKRCDYLESTRTLLQAKRDLAREINKSPLSFVTPPVNRKHHLHQYRHDKVKLQSDEESFHLRHNMQCRIRMSNSEDFDYFAQDDTSSDPEADEAKSSMHKRSYSAGSLDIADIKASNRKKGKNRSGNSKPKTKSSKWTRVKKVITGQKFYEDLGTTIRTFRDRGRTPHMDYANKYNKSATKSKSLKTKDGKTVDADTRSTEKSTVGIHSSAAKRSQNEDDPDLTSDIWMGPPDWWEEYESRLEMEDPTANIGTNSVIEVTTMYLGTNKDTTVSTIEVPVSAPSLMKSHDKFSKAGDSVLHGTTNSMLKDTAEEENPRNVSSVVDNKTVHKSSSCKSADLDTSQFSSHQSAPEVKIEKKLQRSAWGRVKDIIHTRKDSIKKKLKRDRLSLDDDEVCEPDVQICVDDETRPDLITENLSFRPARVSPLFCRKDKTNDSSIEDSAPLHKSPPSKLANHDAAISRGNVNMAAILGGNISEEFTKKMLEWEQLKSKKQILPARDDGDLGSLDLSKIPRELPVRTIDLRDYKGNVPDNCSDVVTIEESNTSMEVLGAPSISVDETPRHRTGGFYSKMQEWEKYKESSRFSKDFTSVVERNESKKIKDDTRKSRRSKEEKVKDKLKRQTERGTHNIDKDDPENKKTELRDMQTLTSECEERLETLNGRINSIEIRGKKRGIMNGEQETNIMCETSGNICDGQKARLGSVHDIVPDDETTSEDDVGEIEDESSSMTTQKCLTTSNIATLERANSQLLENLHKKEIDYAAVQEEVQKVNEKLTKVRVDHATEMARFQSDLFNGKFAGPVRLEVGELEVAAGVLEEKIKMMENLGEKLASSMESAAVGKWQSIEAEETIHSQLIELIEQMRNVLVEASQTEEQSKKMLALSNFETLYAQAMKLQVQMNNLRLSHLERNREIMVIKRQLLLQEVNNLLLQADITRRETELYQFQEAKRFPAFRRWNTFGGTDKQRPQVQVELPTPAVAPTYAKAGPQKEIRSRQGEAPRINIPYLSGKIKNGIKLYAL